jgi:hypothetical protein
MLQIGAIMGHDWAIVEYHRTTPPTDSHSFLEHEENSLASNAISNTQPGLLVSSW